MIEIKNLVKRYGRHMAVDHLNCKIQDGQIYGFLGPNGAGKSTTMNIITGYLAASEGEVVVDGHDILEEPEEAKKCIGYLPEVPPLYMDMRVGEYLEFAAKLKKVPKDKVEHELERVSKETSIENVQRTLIKTLSKGYRQRVGLAYALLGDPKILILDEPTVGLDPKQIIEIRELIRKLGQRHTVILSSHILSEVSAVCDHVLILSHGRLVASETTENLGKRSEMSGKIQITVRASKKHLSMIFDGMEDVKDYSIEPSEEADCCDVVVEPEGRKDIRELLFYRMAEEKCPIRAMMLKKSSLEDIFLKLTESDVIIPEGTEDENISEESEGDKEEQES